MLLFGRGHIAGIDVATQRKDKSKFYDDLLEERRSQLQKEQEEKRLRKIKEKEEQVRSVFILVLGVVLELIGCRGSL